MERNCARSAAGRRFEKFQEMLRSGSVGVDFAQMRKFVLSFPDAKYPGQLKKLTEQNGREDLSDLINKYCYDHVSKDGWEYITSYKLNGCQKRDIDGRHIGHRLYLNIPNNKLYQVADKIVDAFQEKISHLSLSLMIVIRLDVNQLSFIAKQNNLQTIYKYFVN